MGKMNKQESPAHCFAALKLIEQLHRDGLIPAFMFQNILNDYADVVDISAFIFGKDTPKKEMSKA